MSVVYRAIWEDRHSELIETATRAFQRWVSENRLNLEVPEIGQVFSESSGQSNTVTVTRVADSDASALRIRLDEERLIKGGSERWSTIATWMIDGANGWVWIDVEWVSDDISVRPPRFAAPRLVSDLLTARETTERHDHRGSNPKVVSQDRVSDLISWLYDAKRQTPVVVFSIDVEIGGSAYSQRAKETARRLCGCVDVRMLTSDSQGPFHERMEPESMSVFRGAARIYLPGIEADDPEPWRHRFIPARSLTADPNRAADLIVQRILPRMVAQRPPLLYRERISALLTQQGEKDWQEIAHDLDQDKLQLDETVRRLQNDMESLKLDLEIAWEDVDESESENARLKRRLEALRSRLRNDGTAPEVVEQEAGDTSVPSCCSEAAAIARDLTHVVIPPEALRDLDRMDEHPNAGLWGKRILRCLVSLNTYARQKQTGGEVVVSESGARIRAPPIYYLLSSLAMSESDWVQAEQGSGRQESSPDRSSRRSHRVHSDVGAPKANRRRRATDT